MEMHGVTVLQLISDAYAVRPEKILGGPNWLDTDRFEIIARSDSPFDTKTFSPMLQAPRAERFQLKVRKEAKPEPIYALTVAGHAKLQESAKPGNPECKRANEDGYLTMTCTNVTMAYLADLVPGNAPNYFDHPVVDKTGLTGSYDLKFRWTGRGHLGAGDPDHPGMSLIGSMEKDLGIKVDKQTRPADALIVESVNETPSPNPPGTAEKLPPQVTEFEVIEVHASKPGSEQRVDIKNGRLEAIGVSLKEMIGFAYNLDSYMLPNLEKWVETDRFDLIGKTDPIITDGTLMAMVQSLLVTQFHMKSHFTEQDVSVWALTAPKGEGKLKPAAGADRVGCVRAPKDGALTYVCQPHR